MAEGVDSVAERDRGGVAGGDFVLFLMDTDKKYSAEFIIQFIVTFVSFHLVGVGGGGLLEISYFLRPALIFVVFFQGDEIFRKRLLRRFLKPEFLPPERLTSSRVNSFRKVRRQLGKILDFAKFFTQLALKLIVQIPQLSIKRAKIPHRKSALHLFLPLQPVFRQR